MSALAFDTHAFVQRLHAVGFSQEQAEVVVQLQQEVVDSTLEQVHSAELATKHDSSDLELNLKHNFRETELKLELKIAETKSELIRWIVGTGFLQTALITALLLKMSSVL